MLIGITSIVTALFVFWMFLRWTMRTFTDSAFKIGLFVLTIIHVLIAITHLTTVENLLRLFS
jgi:hypothetical protein